jgi:quercetin dioxygenase-like cupin family protein
MEIKTTLQVFNEAEMKPEPGGTHGQTVKGLVGNPRHPTERIRIALATFKPGTLEPLHWHPIEALYYVVSGRAVVRDFGGKEYDAGPGTVIYAPPGIAGSHEWLVKEEMQLLSVRATTDSERKLQLTVDKETKRFYIDFDELIKRGGASFKSLY